MSSRPKLVKLHGEKNYYMYSVGSANSKKTPYVYMLEHVIEYDEKEVIVSASIKINAESAKGKKLISNMIEKQNSALKTALQNIDRDRHIEIREGKYGNLYVLPEEIMEKLKK